jgi:Prophage CP4-57 regulatory protein (AlpA)
MKTFGQKHPRSVKGVRLLDPHALREKGIVYHINRLRYLWEHGLFPRPFNLSPRRIAWREDDIDAWIEDKIRAAEAKRSPILEQTNDQR